MINIILKTDFVSQQEDVKSLFLNTKQNLYLKKGSTGIGGTSVILQATDATRIVVSPTVGMIQGKEKGGSITNKNCFFIYGGSKDTWDDFFNCEGNKVVNCTPEQIILIRKHRLDVWRSIQDTTIFIDEIHQFIPDGAYRDNMSVFLNTVFKEWTGNWILSTATDNTIFGKLLDIPPGLTYTSYNICREDIPIKEIEVLRTGMATPNYFTDIINNSLLNGRKLLIATNNSRLHKIISKLENYNVINLVGDNIETKLRTHKDIEELADIDWNTTHVIMISSKYFAGFDVPVDVDICIDTNPHSMAQMIGVNAIRQIIGRCRTKVGRIVVIISYNMPDSEKAKFKSKCDNEYKYIDYYKDTIETINVDNWFDVSADLINEWNHWQLIDSRYLKLELGRYNYKEIKYNNEDIKKIIKITSYPFADQLSRLLEVDLDDLHYDFLRISKFLKYKMDGIFPPKMAIMYYSCYLIKKYDIDIRIKGAKPSRFYAQLDTLVRAIPAIDLNPWKWELLFAWYKADLNAKSIKSTSSYSNVKLTKKELDYLEIRSQPSSVIISETKSHTEAFFKSLEYLKGIGIEPDEYETDKLESRCIEIKGYKEVDQWKGLRTRKQLLETIGWANLFLLNGEREFYNFPLKRNRTYNPLTQVPAPLRTLIGTRIVEIDINSANPTFIDEILDTNLKSSVYERIMDVYKVDRNRAKIMYNTYLNNHRAKPMDVWTFFYKIGYGDDGARKLTELICGGRGQVYDRMTAHEIEIINTFTEITLPDTKWFRFHDAILLIEGRDFNTIRSIPSRVLNISLNFKVYNDGSKYELPSL
jgi:hypothetical protein